MRGSHIGIIGGGAENSAREAKKNSISLKGAKFNPLQVHQSYLIFLKC